MLLSVGSETSGPITPEVRAAAAGDRRAAHALLTRLLPRVRSLVRYLVPRDDEVDDMAQEALVTIARGLKTFRGEGSLEAWVDRLVARVVFRAMRARRHRRAQLDDALARGADVIALPSAPRDPERMLAYDEMLRVLDRLPEAQRHPLVLHDVLGMTIPEIAEELSTPIETIRSRIKVARARFAVAMQDPIDRDGAEHAEG